MLVARALKTHRIEDFPWANVLWIAERKIPRNHGREIKVPKTLFQDSMFCCSQNFLLNHLRNYVAYHCESMCWKEEFKCAFEWLLPSSTDGFRCCGCWWQSIEIDFLIGEALGLTHQIVSLELNASNGNWPKSQYKYSQTYFKQFVPNNKETILWWMNIFGKVKKQ